MSFQLSFEPTSNKGPIAVIKDSDESKFVYLVDSKGNDNKHVIPKKGIVDSLGLRYFFDLYSEIKDGPRAYKLKKGLKNEDLSILSEALKKQDPEILDESNNSIILEKMYKQAMIDCQNITNNKQIDLEDDSFVELVPPVLIGSKKSGCEFIPTRTCLYITGPSGSGKTTLTGKFVKMFHKMFPGSPVYLFSELDEDPVLDKIKCIRRIKIGENLIEEPIEIKDLEGPEIGNSGKKTSLVIFDDIDVIKDKKVREQVYKIQDSLLQIGRHSEIYTVCTAHMMFNYQKTRILLTECPFVTFFPKSGATWQIERFLKAHIGLNKKQMKKIFDLPSRWVTIYKNYPMYVIHEHGIYLL